MNLPLNIADISRNLGARGKTEDKAEEGSRPDAEDLILLRKGL